MEENRETPFCNIPDHSSPCIQVLPINNLQNEIKSSVQEIHTCLSAMSKNQKKILDLLFGEDLDGGIISALITLKDKQKALSDRQKVNDRRFWGVVTSILLIVLASVVKSFIP